jgi:cytochrome c-type biogenesis protein CcmH/NrfG
MKKVIFVFVIVLIAVSGCKQQRQDQKGQVAYPGGVMMKSPEEIRQIEQLAKQAPKNPEGWIMLGDVLMDSNRFAEAVDAYQKALELDPKNVNVRVDLGTCFRNSQRPQQAVEEYRKALKLEPNHINGNRNLGVVLAYDLNDKKAAAKAFEKYLQLAPNAPDAAEIGKLVQNLKAGK